MKKESSVAIIDHFMELDDPRLNRKKEHLLIDIVNPSPLSRQKY